MDELKYLRDIKTFPSLVKYLRDDLNWPIESDDFNDITFDYEPDDLGIDEKTSAKIKEIKQLRPIVTNQPWGIFFVNFEPKQLPVVVLRRILRALVVKKRFSANRSDISSWQLNDLLFISSYGEQSERAITFANFNENPDTRELPALKVLGWDDQDTVLHLDDVHKTLKDNLHWPKNDSDVNAWREQWSDAFTVKHREVITTSKQLAIRLAHLATIIRKRVKTILNVESSIGPFKMLMQAFKQVLIHDLEKDDFADMYAQTITYGLLAAKVHGPESVITRNLPDLVSNPFLKEMLGMFLDYGNKKGKVDFDEAGVMDVVDLLNSPQVNIEAILKDFGNKTQREDPVIHFYESFLTEYDKEKKIERGVFYTPQPVVSFIVRSVHEKLISDFGLEDGLASTAKWKDLIKSKGFIIPEGVSPDEFFVTILDPAVGTGTFLVEVIDVIAKTMKEKWEKAGNNISRIRDLWNDYVSKSLLPRLYGFELMMAPFVIADIKLTLKLSEISVSQGELFFSSNKKSRFNIFLTNSLEQPSRLADKKLDDMFSPLAHEASAVNDIKRNKHFSVVLGNPPYYGFKSNNDDWIASLANDYKYVDSININEKKHRLGNDYVKFIRLGQFFIENNGVGILAFINDHGFLFNPTFKGMRWNLLSVFNDIYITDLHGNSKKKERNNDGSKDENVFDIQQGVSINIFSKYETKLNNKLGSINYYDLLGIRDLKYDYLINNEFKNVPFISLSPFSPLYLFLPNKLDENKHYELGFSITEIFNAQVTGTVTGNDELLIGEDAEKLSKKLGQIAGQVIDPQYIKNIDYRPFSNKTMYFIETFNRNPYPSISVPSSYRSRYKVMAHLDRSDNYCLIVGRQGQVVGDMPWNIVFLSKSVVDLNIFYRGGGLVCPLYLYHNKTSQIEINQKVMREPNINLGIINKIAYGIDLTFSVEKKDIKNTFAPIDVLDYIYAILHSPTYREKYKEFLKIDFPRVPYPKDKNTFWSLVKLGSELRQIHLLESPVVEKFITKYPIKGGNEVTKIKYEDGKVFINPSQYFSGVPEISWNFYIGGYQPAQKWLKDRKGRSLDTNDIAHYQKIIVALSETDRIMKEIDKITIE